MRYAFLAVFAAVFLASAVAPVAAGEATNTDLKSLINKVTEKWQAGKRNEADFAEELKGFDDLIAKHGGEKTEEVAYIAYTKAMLYRDVLNDQTKCYTLLQQVVADYSDTNSGKTAKMRLERAKAANKLAIGTKFPDFAVLDTAGKPLALANYRGDVVVVNFWASWSVPSLAESLNLRGLYQTNRSKGFEVIGVSLDKEKSKLEGYVKEHELPWRQIFDEQMNDSKLAPECGVTAIPETYLLDGEGNIIAKDIHGAELRDAVTEALAKKEAGDKDNAAH